MLVVGYVRVSTKGQSENGYGLEEQQEQIKQYCLEKEYELLGIYSDAGISGAIADEEDLTIDRPGYNDMLDAIKRNQIQAVVVLTTNRLWRSDMAKAIVRRDFLNLSCEIEAIDRPNYSISAENPNDILINGILELLDVYERADIKRKLTRGRLQKAKLGEYAGGGIPYGYRYDKTNKQIVINEEQAKAVRRIFELYGNCPWLSNKSIADTLNQEGYQTAKGCSFSGVHIRRVLEKRDFYSGIYSYGEIKTKGNFPKIL